MRKFITLAILLMGLIAVVSCSKGASEKELKADPLYGMWSDPNRNYVFILADDTVRYASFEMDGIEVEATVEKKDANTLAFKLPDNGNGTVVLNPETLDITFTVDFGEGPEVMEIPAADHYDLATTSREIASTFLYDEDMTTVVDTLRMGNYYPIIGGKGDHVALGLPGARKGWILGNKLNMLKSHIPTKFLEFDYAQELQGLTGHPERLESYTFNPMDNGKTGVTFHRVYYNGAPAQEQYYVGDLDGIRLNVTHAFSDYNAWEEGNMEAATTLDKPFEITLVDCMMSTPYIRTDNRIFEQREPEY